MRNRIAHQTKIKRREIDMNLIICKCQWKDYYDYRIVTSDAKGHVRVSFFEDEVCISDLYVNESCRCQGIGTKLLDKVDELLNGREATIVPIEDWESEWYKRRGYIVKSDTEQEPIDEEELDKLAVESNPNDPHGDTYEAGLYFGFDDGFKAGYCKAKDQ